MSPTTTPLPPVSAIADPICRVCGQAIRTLCQFDPMPPDPSKPAVLHPSCADAERGRIAAEYAARLRLETAAPVLLRACERAYRSTCATMGEGSDLAITLAAAIRQAKG